MEADINEPKSKAFNIYLRFFQLGFQIAISYWAIKLFQPDQCTQEYIQYSTYIGYAILAISFISLIIIRCSERFPRPFFFITYIFFILMSAGIIVLSVVLGEQNQNNCAANKVLHRFFAAQCIIAILISIVILCTKLQWGQRYSNHPGNLAWCALFLGFAWTNQFHLSMEILGIVNAFITFTSLFVNLIACGGTSTTAKKIIMIQWFIGLLLMIGCEGYAIYLYMTHKDEDLTNFKDQMVLKVLVIFIGVNFIDFFFWLVGLRTLNHQNGDRIRDALFSGEQRQNIGENGGQSLQQDSPNNDIGTINN